MKKIYQAKPATEHFYAAPFKCNVREKWKGRKKRRKKRVEGREGGGRKRERTNEPNENIHNI